MGLWFGMFKRIEEYATSPCRDCGVDTLPVHVPYRAEYYMVHNHIWEAAGMFGMDSGYLCIGCLENRLGRMVSREDFTDCRVNDLSYSNNIRFAWTFRSKRLISRLKTHEKG